MLFIISVVIFAVVGIVVVIIFVNGMRNRRGSRKISDKLDKFNIYLWTGF